MKYVLLLLFSALSFAQTLSVDQFRALNIDLKEELVEGSGDYSNLKHQSFWGREDISQITDKQILRAIEAVKNYMDDLSPWDVYADGDMYIVGDVYLNWLDVLFLDNTLVAVKVGYIQRGCYHEEGEYDGPYETMQEAEAAGCEDSDVQWQLHSTFEILDNLEIKDIVLQEYMEWSGH